MKKYIFLFFLLAVFFHFSSAAAEAAIIETGNASASSSANTATSSSITHGLTINANDVVIAFVYVNDDGNAITDDNGSTPFTEVLEDSSTVGTATYAIYRRVAGAAEPATYKWTHAANTTWRIILRVFDGVDTTNFFDVTPSMDTDNSGVSSLSQALSITTVNDGSLGMVAVFSDSNAEFSSPTNGYGTEIEAGSEGFPRIASYIRTWATAGATGAVNITMSFTDDWTTQHFSLKPATSVTVSGTASQDISWVKGGTTAKNFVFTVNNSASSGGPLQWIKITRPSANYTIIGGSASGWSANTNGQTTTFTGGSLSAGSSGTFTVTADTFSGDEAQAAWTVEIDNDTNGTTKVAATESSSNALKSGIDSTAPTNVSIESVTANSASQLTAKSTAAADSASGLHNYPYWFDETSGNSGGSDSGDWQSSTSWADMGLSLSVQYCYRVKARDVVLNESAFSAPVCQTTASSSGATTTTDTAEPNISAIAISSITANSATITWITNEVSDSQVEYGTTTGYGSQTTLDSSLVTSHSLIINNLNPATTYNYRVKSKDASGNLAMSANNIFATSPAGVAQQTYGETPPVLSQISAKPATSTAKITWTADMFSTSQVEYGTSTNYGQLTPTPEPYTKLHERTLLDLLPNTNYNFRVISINLVGGKTSSGNFTFTTDKLPPPPAPKISDVSVIAVQPSSAKIAWKTDAGATAQIIFGTKSGELTQATTESISLAQDHSVTIPYLAPETTYYFVAVSRNATGVEASSSESSFTTEKLEIQTVVDVAKPVALPVGSPGTQVPKTAAGETVTLVPILPTKDDKESPQVTLLRFRENPTENTSPTISGRANDKNGVIAGVSYSSDGGSTWHPVQEVVGIGSSAARFSTRIENIRDGNYPILFRVRDNSGNVGRSEIRNLIIDVKPPSTGANVLLLGSQSILPSSSGVFSTLTGITQRMVISAGGGAISVDIVARKKFLPQTEIKTGALPAPPLTTQEILPKRDAQKQGDATFPLAYSKTADLWFGDIRLNEAGLYDLEVRATDGAGKISNRQINPFLVSAPGIIRDKKTGAPLSGATVSVYQFFSEFNDFLLWPGEIFNQASRQITGTDGTYRFILPPGKYYLKAEKTGYKMLWTDIMEFSDHKIVNFSMELKPRLELGLPWPIFGITKIFPFPALPDFYSANQINDESPATTTLPENIRGLIGKTAPRFVLPATSEGSIDVRYLRGKNAVLSLWSTWAPLAQSQVPILNNLQKQEGEDLRVLLISLQESLGTVDTYLRRGKYDLTAAVDNEAQIAKTYPILTLPEHIFIDRRGVVRDVYVGFLGNDQFLRILRKL